MKVIVNLVQGGNNKDEELHELPQLEVEDNVTPALLNLLVNKLLDNDETLPYTFLHDGVVIESALKDVIDAKGLSRENTIEICYVKQSLFRVRPVTRCHQELPGHTEAVLCITFNQTGKLIASGSGDKTVRVWDVETATPVSVLEGHQAWVLSVAFSPCGRYLASGAADGSVFVWRNFKGQGLKPNRVTLMGHKGFVTSVAWEPLHLAISRCKGSTSEGTELPVPHLATASKDGTVRIWNGVDGKCIHIISDHKACVTDIRWGGLGLIYTTSEDTHVRAFKVDQPLGSTPVRVMMQKHLHWTNSVSLSTDYVIRCGNARFGEFISGKEIQTQVDKVIEQNGGELVCVCSDDKTLTLYRVSKTAEGFVSNRIAQMPGHGQPVSHCSFSPDGLYIASSSFDRSVKLWSSSGAKLASLVGHVQRVFRVAFSADSRLILSCSEDSTAKVWSVIQPKRAKTRLVSDLPGHTGSVYCCDWAPNGSCAVTGGKDKLVKIWRG